ncbi:MAG: DUF4173 domain-containing protein [Solirubrobacteraceae bacterium]|nr:DUF4173 domain-containing protein [Solirubrobacteraceae bacterium]
MSEAAPAVRAPRERGSTRARFTIAALGAGLLAAMLLPHAPAGLGFVVVAVALAGAAALGGRPARPLRSALLGGLALALAASAAVRDAGWVVGVELVAAVALGSLAMSAPRTWRGSILGAVAAPLRMPSGARLVAAGAVRALPRGSRGQAFALGRGLLLTGVLLTIFGALFATGDRAFAQIAGDVLPDEVPLGDLPLRLLVLGLVVSLAGGLAQAAAIADEPARGPLLRLGRGEWLLALGALNSLFALFVAVQIAVLFGGDDYVRDSAGLTYAEYARSGFAQLVVVAGLTLAVVAGALRWARTESVGQARLLRALLSALCLLTLVVLASALHRLGLYEQAYGFTRARLAVHGLLLFGGALFGLVVVALATDRRGWLARATVLLAAGAALLFWVSDPDRRIAAHNVERYEATGRIDTDYLARLSADAVPALMALPARLREPAVARQRARLAGEPDGLAGANAARSRARDALDLP